MSVKENKIEAELVRRVREAGGIADKVRVIGRRGFFDRLVILPNNRIFFVECKKPAGGRVSPHQDWYHKRYRALAVAIVLVRNSADIDRLMLSPKK